MDIYQNEFTSFLSYIGLLSEKTESLFKRSLDYISDQTEDIKSSSITYPLKGGVKYIVASALEIFLMKLTKDQSRDIAWSIINKYQTNKWKSKKELLIKMLIIYSKSHLATQYQSFLRWSKSALNQKKKKNDIKPVRCYYSFEDSMQPQGANGNADAHNASAKNSNTLSNSNALHLSINKPNPLAVTSFLNRQKQFKESQAKVLEKVLKDSEEEYALICTFNPRINSEKHSHVNQSNEHACLRLYDERISRQNRREQVEKNAIDKVKRDTSYNKTKVNEKKIIQLYEDFKIRKNNKRLLEKKVDSELGYTYTPDISSLNNSIKKIPSSLSSTHITMRSRTPIDYRADSFNNKSQQAQASKRIKPIK